jgi:hypothetical protein
MKKLLLIVLALNFAACSNDSSEISTSPAAIAKKTTFNPEPTPEDYLNAQYPDYIASIEALQKSNQTLTSKTAAFVSTYVPDAAFRAALINIGAAQDASPGDQYIEIDNTRGGLYIPNAGITDLTGINAFTSLVQLIVSSNNLTTINVSGLTNLQWIECQGNQLTTLNLSANTKLYQVWCQNNLLTSLTLPVSPNLWGVWCYSNQLTTLNLNGNTSITDLFIQGNQISTFNFAPFVNLKQTNISSNKWVTVNVDSNGLLTLFWCTGNTLLTDLYMRSPTANNINNQSFSGNKFGLKIHVISNLLGSAMTLWPSYGTATYVL